MKVFLSWSGERSRQVALQLRDWLPNVIQALDPWMSAEDIAKGAPWLEQIRASLGQAKGIGIFCVTPENAGSPWLNFEAGFLASCDEARVCVVALDMEPADLRAPLNLFQATSANPQDFKKLVESLNAHTERPLSSSFLDRSFNTYWPALNGALEKLAAQKVTQPKATKRTTEEMLHELVESNRRIESALASPTPPPQYNEPGAANRMVGAGIRRPYSAPTLLELLEVDPSKLNLGQRRRMIDAALDMLADEKYTDFDRSVIKNKIEALKGRISA